MSDGQSQVGTMLANIHLYLGILSFKNPYNRDLCSTFLRLDVRNVDSLMGKQVIMVEKQTPE